MTDLPVDLNPEIILSLLRTTVLARDLRVLGEVSSTNDVALAVGRDGAAEGVAILADRQSAGRGRLGRTWESPPGVGIYTSVLLRPRLPASLAPLLTLAAGIAAAETIQEVTRLAARLKWPNDVQLDGRKVAGILIEGTTLAGRLGEAVVGIGINVNQEAADFPPGLGGATSLRLALGRGVSRAALVATLYNTLEHWYRVLCGEEWGAILDRGRQWSAVLGQPVEVHSGAERWCGLAWDLDRDGSLIVRDATGAMRRVVAGDVSIRQPGAFTKEHRECSGLT